MKRNWKVRVLLCMFVYACFFFMAFILDGLCNVSVINKNEETKEGENDDEEEVADRW